jgi:hemerythrin-like domain-containing protein
MDIYQIIKQDHRKVLDAISKLEDSTERVRSSRQQQLSAIRDDLLPHMHAEENLFYPLLLDKGNDRQKVLEAFEEHRVARSVMQDLESTSADDERWSAKLSVLKELLTHHIQEEEGGLFTMAKKIIDDRQAQEMGDRFQSIEQGEMAGAFR